MKPFLVHVEREDIDEHTMDVRLPGGDRDLQTYFNSWGIKLNSTLDSNKPGLMETWYCASYVAAEKLAAKLAIEMPGRIINIYELKGVVKTVPSAPVFAKYTEKGLLPV